MQISPEQKSSSVSYSLIFGLAKTHLGDIFAESMAFELLALYPHFCIFLLNLDTQCFCSSTLGASKSNSLAYVGSWCNLHGAK